jgi:hypothetical protein
MKELFLSSLMQWMSSNAASRIDEIVIERAGVLRQQMSSVSEEPVAVSCDDED